MASKLRNEITHNHFGLPSKFEIRNSEMYMKTWRQYGASHATYFELFLSANDFQLLTGHTKQASKQKRVHEFQLIS